MNYRNDATNEIAPGHSTPHWTNEDGHAVEIDPALVAIVDADATESARLFVEEFGEAWDDETNGDWDAEAFANGDWKGRRGDVQTYHEELWPHWSRLFRTETERLAAESP